MKILGIESSSLVASAAIVTDDILTAEYTVNFKKTHSQTLLPMIDEIVSMTETDLNEIDAIAVSGGPGSFTGLRHSQGSGPGAEKASDPHPHGGRPGIQPVGGGESGVSHYGCEEKSGVHRHLPDEGRTSGGEGTVPHGYETSDGRAERPG